MNTPTATKTKMPFVLLRTLKYLGIALLSLVAMLVIALTIGFNINLTLHKQKITHILESQINRSVKIDGDIRFHVSFRPELEINNIEVANIPSIEWQPLLRVGHASAKVAIFPLFENTLFIDYIDLEGIHLYLAKDMDGNENWAIGKQAESANPQITSAALENSDNSESRLNSESTLNSDSKLAHWTVKLGEKAVAKSLSVIYEDQSTQTYVDWFLDEFDLTKDDKIWHLNTRGAALGQEYNLSVTGEIEKLLNAQTGSIDIKGHFAGASLEFNSNIQPNGKALSTANIQLDWLDTQPIEALLGLDVYHIAPLSISADISAKQGALHVKSLNVDSPITQAEGYLDIALGDVNTIDGKLTIPVIDLKPWLQPEPEQHMMGYSSAPQQKSPLQQALDQWLVSTQTNLSVSIGEILGLGTKIKRLSLAVVGEKGTLNAPVSADIAQVPFRGKASIDATEWSSTLKIELGAQDSPLGELAHWLAGIEEADGHLENALLSVQTEGTKLKEWIDNSHLAFVLDNAAISWAEGANFAIEKARFKAGMNQPVDVDIRGNLQGVPATITAKAGALSDIINKRDWETTITLDSPILNIHAFGSLPETRWQVGSQFKLDISSPNIAKLSPWLGTQSGVSGPLKLNATLEHQNEWLTLSTQNLRVMDSRGRLALKWLNDPKQSFVDIDADFSKLDFNQLALLAQEETLPEVEQAIPTQGVNLSVPILSNDINIVDADISLNVGDMRWSNQSLKHITFSGKLRNGMMKPAPFSMRLADNLMTGDLAVSINAAQISSTLNLKADSPNIAAIAQSFGIADDMDMELDSARISLSLSGKTLLEFMEMTQVQAVLEGGYLKVPDIYTGKSMDIRISEGRFHTGPELNTELLLTGSVQDKKTTLSIHSVSLKEANRLSESLPANVLFTLGDIKIEASTDIALPLDFTQLELQLNAAIPNLERLNEFTGVKLPPYGPIDLSAKLSLDDVQYQLQQLVLNIGESELIGTGQLRPLGKYSRPDIALSLSSSLIQMDDFKVGNWKAWIPNAANQEASNHKPTVKENTTQPLIVSPEGLSWANVEMSLEVSNVRSGNDWLGATSAKLSLLDGKLRVSPLKISIPGGSVSLAGQIEAQQDLFDIAIQGQVHHFDYGVIARRIDNKTDMGGNLSTYFNLTSLANTPDSLMNNANGFIGFSIWPQEFEADLIDLWAVNLTDAILPSFTKEQESVLNCVAGGFDITNGDLQQRDLLLDTTRIQVNGNFSASYSDRTFDLYLAPRPKSAQIFSLQTPIEVSGNFEDFDLSVPFSAILETSVRFTTSPVISPIRWLVEKPLDSDGSHLCEMISRGTPIKK
ncbi:AsmA family protein [Vibrio penaeicida]|uniref:AsmA family protein n=1 Tax=Vibrio penaeicida TaxID=104609 RepID=UPI002734C707|nr:AsmA family protein [Vibrio penaeicida]MDP2571125.1 AsmA family protein [Vibrio penaeicida]